MDVLERNFNRVQNLEIENEMSNTLDMSHILRKFPRSVSEIWFEHLAIQTMCENEAIARVYHVANKYVLHLGGNAKH